jgi:uncharacterized protein (TIGR04222 family)
VANPLDLPGPQFLVFYAFVALVILTILWLVRGAAEGGPPARIDTSDPFLIAHLRGGPDEAVRVAAVSLIDRGLLVIDEQERTLKAKPGATALRPIEQALQRKFAEARPATDIFTDFDLRAACFPYEDTLTRLGLLADDGTQRARHRRFGIAVAILVGLAGAKIYVALQRGRTNVLFLIILAFVVCVAAFGLSTTRRTARGDALVTDLRRLFGRLRARAGVIRPGGGTADAALLAAVFGLGTLPAAGFGFVRRLYPRAPDTSGWSSGWSSPSYGSWNSCSSSCGSSCGGGGGGGCGGCGSSGAGG